MSRQNKLNKSMDELFPQEDSSSCRVCNEDVVDGRWNYCSERCRDIATAVQKMFLWDSVREATLERDGYTCQECGLSREQWLRAYRQVREVAKERTRHLYEDDEYDAWRTKKQQMVDRYGVEFPKYHVDHIHRIADGGHPLEESNLQTLCKHCHHSKTAEENSNSPAERPEISLEEYMES